MMETMRHNVSPPNFFAAFRCSALPPVADAIFLSGSMSMSFAPISIAATRWVPETLKALLISSSVGPNSLAKSGHSAFSFSPVSLNFERTVSRVTSLSGTSGLGVHRATALPTWKSLINSLTTNTSSLIECWSRSIRSSPGFLFFTLGIASSHIFWTSQVSISRLTFSLIEGDSL